MPPRRSARTSSATPVNTAAEHHQSASASAITSASESESESESEAGRVVGSETSQSETGTSASDASTTAVRRRSRRRQPYAASGRKSQRVAAIATKKDDGRRARKQQRSSPPMAETQREDLITASQLTLSPGASQSQSQLQSYGRPANIARAIKSSRNISSNRQQMDRITESGESDCYYDGDNDAVTSSASSAASENNDDDDDKEEGDTTIYANIDGANGAADEQEVQPASMEELAAMAQENLLGLLQERQSLELTREEKRKLRQFRQSESIAFSLNPSPACCLQCRLIHCAE